MKKLLIFLLLPLFALGQTSTGQEQEFPYGILVPVSVLQVPTTTTWIGTFGADGTQGKVAPQNISIPQIPVNYSVLTPTIGSHLDGIDTKLGSIVATTAGQTTRVWFTADVTVVSATNYYATGTTKGTAASAIQSVVNDDNQKKYFTQDVIGAPFVSPAMFPPGVYAGNLSASTTPNSAQQRWTVELYKCDNSGTPIASGVTGAAVGSLGVTVITILDSGLLTLADGSVTNVQVSGNLGGTGFSINAGERVRYHVSAEKVGTAASNITQSVYYGTSYNSFIDVTVPLNTNSVVNLSDVSGATTTDALNTLKAAIPVVYSTVVYVNATDPNSATIFDDVNPPVSNDPLLEDDVNNLYVASDNTGWVYNSTSLLYVTKPATAPQSNFNVTGTGIDAGSDKYADIERPGSISTDGYLSASTAIISRYGASNTVFLGSNVRLMTPTQSDGNVFQLNASNGIDVWNFVSGTPTKRFTFSSTGDFNASGNITGGIKVRKISTNTTLADSDNGTVILLTASCTVTLPNGLMSGFNCSFSTATGATLTYALGGSVTLINNTGTTMAQNLSHTIVNTGTSNEYLVAGSL